MDTPSDSRAALLYTVQLFALRLSETGGVYATSPKALCNLSANSCMAES